LRGGPADRVRRDGLFYLKQHTKAGWNSWRLFRTMTVGQPARSVRPQIHARLRRRAGVGGRAMRSWRCELEQNAPADLVGILVAPIAEDHDAELPVRPRGAQPGDMMG
jgi:hypothetical protein